MLSRVLANHPVVAELAAQDPGALLDGKLDRGETTLIVAPARIREVCQFLKQRGFTRLSSITAVDWYPAEPRFEVVYHLHNLGENVRLRLKCRLTENESIASVSAVWRAANWYEREVWDLFGIRFDGHPNLRRILLPEDWTDHPLRKDFPVHGRRYGYAREEAG
ncbi:MAG: NADH-quinone oxidoreductase subunit C [Bryobacterales bacterium]|nr:NADH-quinone oxidoreductase subunit C [Bryobacteraceae bacterium]MDW8131100.1 NADH-quinone oxidoreductase subunit C [Bryobacterales bacterium]